MRTIAPRNFSLAFAARMISFSLPADYPRIKRVNSFQELVTTPFAAGVNALCWERTVGGQDVVGCGRVAPSEAAAAQDTPGSPGYRSRLDAVQLAALLADECEP